MRAIHPRFGEFAERICSKQLPLNLLYHILPQKAPHHRKFPHRPTFTPPPPSAHCPQKRSHTPQLQQNSPSHPSPTTALQHSPSFFDPFPDETTRFRSLPLQKVHPAFHPAPSPIPKQPDSKASLPPKQPSHTPSVQPAPISQQHRLPRSSCRPSKIDIRPIPATNRFKLKKGAMSRKIRNITPFRSPPRRKRNVSPIFKSPQNTDSASSKS